MRRTLAMATTAGVAAAFLLPLLATNANAIVTGPVYVSTTGTASASGTSCATAKYSVIQTAVDAAPLGSTVTVCAGTYKQSVTIGRKVNLAGLKGAVIDATGQVYGVGTTASWVTISGLTVENASDATDGPADGIITAGFGPMGPVPADHVTITGNVTKDNVGAGIDVNSSSYSTINDNSADDNGIGINVSDDLGAGSTHDAILGNTANGNPGGCGIVLAEHSGLGIDNNKVVGNTADDNGLGTPSAPDASSGSGIILAGAAPTGGVYDNDVVGNTFIGNGHGGVALHAHVPGTNFSGNIIAANRIGTNNVRTDFADLQTTGIYLADASALKITIAANLITDDHYGIFTAGPVTIVGAGENLYLAVTKDLGSTPSYP
jgi:parallel beta-helix repeat protein